MQKSIKVTVDFNFKFKGPEGKEVAGIGPANQVVASMIFNGASPKENKRRNVGWADKLSEDGKLELEPVEMDDILAVCDQQGIRDGYYIALENLFNVKREEWRAAYEEYKNGPRPVKESA